MLRRGSQLVLMVSVLVIVICVWILAAERVGARADHRMDEFLRRLLSADPDPEHPIELATLQAAAAEVAASCFGPLAPAGIQSVLLAHSLHRVMDQLAGNAASILIAGQLVYLLGANKSHNAQDYAWACIKAAETLETEYAILSNHSSDERALWFSHRRFALALLDLADLLDWERPIAALYCQRASINRSHPDVLENRKSKLAQARIRLVAADLDTLRKCPDAASYQFVGQLLGSIVEEAAGNDGNARALRVGTLQPAHAAAMPPGPLPADDPASGEFGIPLPPAASEDEPTPLPEDCPEPESTPAVFE